MEQVSRQLKVETNSDNIEKLISNLESCDLRDDFKNEEGERKRKQLIEVAKKLVFIAPKIIRKFTELCENAGFPPGKVSFYIVGGRVLNTPIKENTDFDFVLTSENEKLNPLNFNKMEVVENSVRHEIDQELQALIKTLFTKYGIADYYEDGILETKGLGNESALLYDGENAGNDILKIAGSI